MASVSDRPAHKRWLTIAALLAFAALTRVWRLGHQNIWLDEVASWTDASYPLSQLLASVARDVHPPLYYLMLKGWMSLAGDGPVALRAPSVACGILAVLLSWLLGRRWLTGPTRSAALAWIVLSPHLVFFSQEARMYAPATAAVLAACLAYRRWIESQCRSIGALAGYAAAMTAAMYLHYFTALIALAFWIHLAIVRQEPRVWVRWLIAHAAILIAYLPWLGAAIEQIDRGQPWRQAVPITQVPRYALVFIADVVAGYHMQWSLLIGIASLVIVAVMFMGAIRLVVAWIRERREPDLFLLLAIAVPIVVSLAALLVTGHMTLSRYLAYLTPLLVIGVARGWSESGAARPRVAAIAMAAIASAALLASYYRDPVRDFDVRPVIRALSSEPAGANSRDAVLLFDPAFLDICFKYYAREPLMRYERVPPDKSTWQAVREVASGTDGSIFVVVARNSVTFDTQAAPDQLRLEEVALEPSWPDRIRLFRVLRTR